MMLSRIVFRSTAWSMALRTRTSSSGGRPACRPMKTTRMPPTSCTVNFGSFRSAGSCVGAGNSTMSASPGLERDHPRALFRHHLEDHAVEQRLVAPVVRVPLEDHVGVGLPLHELEGPGADGRAAEALAHLLDRGGRDDAHAVHGERAQDGPVRVLGHHVDGEVVDDLGARSASRRGSPSAPAACPSARGRR